MYKKQIGISLLFPLMIFSASSVMAIPPPTTTVVLMHVSNTLSHFEPNEEGIGGYARLGGLVASVRKKYLHTESVAVGDITSGTVWYTVWGGEKDIAAFNMMGLDILSLGGGEFQKGSDHLAKLLSDARFSVITANAEWNDHPLSTIVSDYVVRSYGPIKIGYFGITADEVNFMADISPVRFKPHIATAQAAIDKLRDLECDFIVLLPHLRWWEVKELVENTEGIDLVVGGFCDMLVGDFYVNRNGQIVRYTRSKDFAESLGIWELVFDQENRINWNASTYGEREITPELRVNLALESAVAEWRKNLDILVKETVGYADDILSAQRPDIRQREMPLGNLITDAMLWQAEKMGLPADIALFNGGAIRSDLTPPEITLEEIYEAFPFNDTVELFPITGSDLLEALDNGVSRVQMSHGGFPHVSGMRYTYDFDTQSLVSAEIKTGYDTYVPVDPGAPYQILTRGYLSRGGDGYSMFASVSDKLKHAAGNETDILVSHLKETTSKGQPLRADDLVQDRITVVK